MTSSETRDLQRGIGSRQLSMIAIGGAIGTGLFFASGSAIAQAGPGGAMLAYAVMGLAVYCMMQSLGEMATQLPIPGSFEAYAERFIDPSVPSRPSCSSASPVTTIGSSCGGSASV